MTDDTTAQADTAPAAGETAPTAAEAALATQQTTTTAEPAKPAPQTAAADDAGDEDGDGTGKKPSRSQRLQRKVQLLAAENEELRRGAPPARPAQDAGSGSTADAAEKPPQEKDFNGDYLAYERALNAWNVEQSAMKAARKVASEERAQRAASHEAETRRERVLAHQDRVEELKERVPDFDDVMKTAANLRINDEVAAEIIGSDKSALIQLYLAKNPDKVSDLNGLTGRELARAVGRLEGAVRLPAAKRATDATPPVVPLAGGGTAASFDPFKSDMDQYAANFRERQKAREQRRA